MSETIRGKLQEIVAGATGTNKRGKWTAWKVKVDDNLYGTGFEKVKAAVGDVVEFESEENDKGYDTVVDGTFKVVKKATSEESAAVSKANGESESGRQSSIEAQVTLKAAVDFVGFFGLTFDEALTKLPQAYRVLAACLHPPVKAAVTKAKAKPAAEEESQDSDDDDRIPY